MSCERRQLFGNNHRREQTDEHLEGYSHIATTEIKLCIERLLEQSSVIYIRTAVGTNLCVRGPLEVKSKGIRGVGGVADKEAYTVHTINISQRQYFVAHCLSSCVGNVFGSHSMCVCLVSTTVMTDLAK
jgi:hypothetical protein